MQKIILLAGMALMLLACHSKKTVQTTTGTSFTGTYWKLTKVSGFSGALPATPNKEPFIKFSSADGRYSSTAGCNSIGGSYTHNGASLNLGQAMMTRMMCAGAVNDLENAFVKMLSQVNSYVINGSTLQLLHDKAVIAEFKASVQPQ